MNRGARLFTEMTAERGKKAGIAREMNRDPASVTRWGTGEKKPDSIERAWLEDHLGIPWRTWDIELEESDGSTAA